MWQHALEDQGIASPVVIKIILLQLIRLVDKPTELKKFLGKVVDVRRRCHDAFVEEPPTDILD